MSKGDQWYKDEIMEYSGWKRSTPWGRLAHWPKVANVTGREMIALF